MKPRKTCIVCRKKLCSSEPFGMCHKCICEGWGYSADTGSPVWIPRDSAHCYCGAHKSQ